MNTIIDKNLAEFLNGAENEIRFCANKPQSFLTILTGAKLDLKLKEVSGVFVQDEKHENQYILDLRFLFKNEKYLKAGNTEYFSFLRPISELQIALILLSYLAIL